MLAFEKTALKWEIPKAYTRKFWQHEARGMHGWKTHAITLALAAMLVLMRWLNVEVIDGEPQNYWIIVPVAVAAAYAMTFGVFYLTRWLARWCKHEVRLQQTGFLVWNNLRQPEGGLYKQVAAYRVREIAPHHVVRFTMADGRRIQACLPEDAAARADALRELEARLGPAAG